ncbi:hypothetical protein Dda_4029 [Drechslerella dactyloides]|uniref:Uncharacterized protein n=1 Tax=Drechslerella dactyloides TaxID=74499 RepID=A0AAD6IZ02_DREDA|nr:hypothetical protein Dda_4029 [Drechslerella dactyloides]
MNCDKEASLPDRPSKEGTSAGGPDILASSPSCGAGSVVDKKPRRIDHLLDSLLLIDSSRATAASLFGPETENAIIAILPVFLRADQGPRDMVMHPPVLPGEDVFVNGGKAVAAAGSEQVSVDGIPRQPLGKNSGRPLENVGNCSDDRNRSAGSIESKDLNTQKDGAPNGLQPPPRSGPANISDLRLPLAGAKPGSSTGDFVPLPLTSPTGPVDQAGKGASEILDMAAKSPTESQSDIKSEVKKPAQDNGTKANSPPSGSSAKSREPVPTTNMRSGDRPGPAVPNGESPASPPNPKSGAPYIEDSDSEDEELQELLAQKRDQIKQDIAYFQRTKEMELLIYEKRLRDDHMRRKRRKQAMANGHSVASGSPRSYYSLTTKNVIGNIPGYLPLTPAPGAAPVKSSGLKKLVADQTDGSTSGSEATESESQKPDGSAQPEHKLVSHLDAKEDASKPEIVIKPPSDAGNNDGRQRMPSPAISPVAPFPNSPKIQSLLSSPQAQATQILSASALKALEGNERVVVPLPGSLKSTSSWASGSAKDSSRRSSVNDHKTKKNKRVVFQLEIEGDWFRVKPDGEEVPMEPEEKERLKTESAALSVDYDTDSESDYLEFKVPSNKESLKSPVQDAGYHAIEQLEGIATSTAAKPSKGPEDPDWVPTKPLTEPAAVMSSSKSTISEDSMEEDVFDLDEELPYDPPTAPPEFTSGSLEDSVMSLGLPLAPPPPPPPSAPGLPIPAPFGAGRAGGSVADTLAYIQAYQQAGISRGSSTSESYLSSSFPRNSFGGTSGSWRDPAAPPRPSSSHGSSTAPTVPTNVVTRRASGSLDLVTAPTLEMLSSSISASSSNQGGAAASGNLPIGSGFRRRSVTKYDIPDEDIKDSSASSSVTSKSDLTLDPELNAKAVPSLAPPVAATASRKTPLVRPSSEMVQKSSPYGSSMPISIPPRHAMSASAIEEQLAAPEQVQDDVPKEVVSGRPSPTSSNTTEKSNQPTTTQARSEAQKKSILSPTSVEAVLEATTEALSKNALPSSMSTKPKREQKASRSGSSTPKYGSYNKKSPSPRPKKVESNAVKPEPWHGTIVQNFPSSLGNKSFALDAAQAVSSPSWNSYNSTSVLSTSLPKYASGSSAYSFGTNPITALPGVKSYSPTAPTITHSSSPRKGPITLNSGPRYSSTIAEETAATVEAKGLPSESVVGRPDQRLGVVDPGIISGNGLVLTEVGPESVKETLLAKEPGSLSLSQRLALEEAGEPVGTLGKK